MIHEVVLSVRNACHDKTPYVQWGNGAPCLQFSPGEWVSMGAAAYYITVIDGRKDTSTACRTSAYAYTHLLIKRCDVPEAKPIMVKDLGNGSALIGIELEHSPHEILMR